MKKPETSRIELCHSKLIFFAFFVTIIFQITVYKEIWHLELLSRISNLIFLIIFSGYAFFFTVLRLSKYDNIKKFYIIPGWLIYIGCFINILRQDDFNPSQFSILLPWSIYLCIPNLLKNRHMDVSLLWRYFNCFMLAAASLSLIEFIIIPIQIYQNLITISPNSFVDGLFSRIWITGALKVYYRFFSFFPEPGTLAMFLLPVICYTYLSSKYIRLLIYSISFFLTDSLGGKFALITILPLLIYFRHDKKSIFYLFLILLGAILASSLIEVFLFTDFIFHSKAIENFNVVHLDMNFYSDYINKAKSASIREDNIINFLKNFKKLILLDPFGLPLTSENNLLQKNFLFFGSTFSLNNIFNSGGILALIGYCFILFSSAWYFIAIFLSRNPSLEDQIVSISLFGLITFIMQRMSIWDTSLFALLFSPFLIKFLDKPKSYAPRKRSKESFS